MTLKISTQKTFLLAILFIFQGIFVSCNKDDKKKENRFANTEWSDDSGTWLFSFHEKTGNVIALAYTIQMDIPRTLKYNIPYQLDGNNLIIKDYKASAHGNDFFLIKDFKGKISENRIVCDFKTPSTKSEGGKMPDLSKLEQVQVILNKKR